MKSIGSIVRDWCVASMIVGAVAAAGASPLRAQDDKLVFLVVRGLLTIDRYEARGARWETETPEVVTVDGEPRASQQIEPDYED